MSHDVIWNGDIRGPHRGFLCLDPGAAPSRWSLAPEPPRCSDAELRDAIALVLPVLRRHGYAFRPRVLSAWTGLPLSVVIVTLQRLVRSGRVAKTTLVTPDGRLAGYRIVDQAPRAEAC